MRLGSEKKSLCRYSVKDVDQSQWDFMLPTMHLDNIITSIHNLGLKYPNKKTRLSQSIVFFSFSTLHKVNIFVNKFRVNNSGLLLFQPDIFYI